MLIKIVVVIVVGVCPNLVSLADTIPLPLAIENQMTRKDFKPQPIITRVQYHSTGLEE